MIVAAPSIIIPVNNVGWARPLLSVGEDRNFSYPDGKRGLITGIVASVPAGTLIKPYFNPASSLGTANCIVLSKYTPPTWVKYSIKLERDGAGWYKDFEIEHDAEIITPDGSSYMPNANNLGPNKGEYFGTWCRFSYPSVAATLWTNVTYTFTVHTMRGGFLRVTEYEEGPAGIVTVNFTGEATAVRAVRLSDNTQQVLSNGGLVVPAGKRTVNVDVTWGSGIDPVGLLAKLEFVPEVPYGL